MKTNHTILAINGSYRVDGITDQAVDVIASELREFGADVEHVQLRDIPIEFCLNCRECMQQPGEAPGKCVHGDNMGQLVAKIERADAYVLAAPTNFGTTTALFKRFLERLAVYAYWPWGANAPRFRKVKVPKKPALLVSSCTAPGIFGRLLYGTRKELKTTAKTIGGKPVGTFFAGLVSDRADATLSGRVERKARKLAQRLSSGLAG